jgi:hypothetical protein
MNNIIFLDIDGVLATFREFLTNKKKFQEKNEWAALLQVNYPFNPDCVNILNEIIEKTNANIVLSSDWRLYYTLEELDNIFKYNGLIKSPFDITTIKTSHMGTSIESLRLDEINDYIDKNDVKNWVIIDDLDMKLKTNKDRFFLTRDFEGLKQTSMKEKIINKLLENYDK